MSVLQGVLRRRRGLEVLARPELLLLLLWPLVLIAANPRWIYGGSSEYNDAWIYTGYFLNWPALTSAYGDTDYGSRVSWIAPGYLAYKLLPPLVANLVLRLLVFWTTILSIYGVLTYTVNRRAATLAALLMGCYPFFLLSAGWDYVDGIGCAYFALTLLLLTLASRQGRGWLYLGLAGVAGVLMVSAHLFLAVFAVPLACWYLLVNRTRSRRSLLLGLLPLGCGAALTVVTLGLINLRYGGPLLYMLPSVRFSAYMNSLSSNPWIATRPDWPLQHGYLVWPQAIVVASLLFLALPRLRAQLSTFPHARPVLILALLTHGLMLVWQVQGAIPVMEAVYYASYLLPTTFLALGALLAPALARISRGQFVAVVGLAGLLGVLALLFRFCGPVPTGAIRQALVLAAACVAVLTLWPGRGWHLAPFVVALTLATPSPQLELPPLCRPEPRQGHLAVLDASAAVRQLAPWKKVHFWYNNAESSLYRAVSSTFLYTSLSEVFPLLATPSGEQASLDGVTTIAVLTQHEQAPLEAARALQAQGLRLRPLGTRLVQQGSTQFSVWLFDLVPQPLSQNTPRPLQADLVQVFGLTAADGPSPYLQSGWSSPEEAATWTKEPQATLALPFTQAPTTSLRLTLSIPASVAALNPAQPEIKVALTVNGTYIDTWTLTAARPGAEVSALIPAAVAGRSQTMQVALAIDHPYTPQGLGYDGDQRLLGIAVDSVEVVPLP